MEEEMKELEERQRSLGRVFDSSVLAFTVQWKELGDYFESTRKKLRTRLEDLEERVKLVAEVEAKAARVKSETEAKEKELGEMEEAVAKKRREVEEGNNELSRIKWSMEGYREKIRVNDECKYSKKSWKLKRVEMKVEEKLKEVKVEERRLDEIRELIEVKREELEECESELEMKEERLRLVETSIVNCDRVLELKEKSPDIGQALGIASPASPQTLQEPAELVLDWMQTEFSDYWTKADVCLEATSIKTCIFVLEKLMRDVPHVRPHVEEDAMKLAFKWKAKMRADVENAWEILGYLLFIAAYELVYTLDVDEIVKHLGMISQNKEALEFCQTLPYADKIPGEFIHCLVEMKQLMEAIGFSCSFKLIKKFPPAPLLKEYVEEKMKCCRDGYTKEKINNAKVKVVDLHITDLRAVINLIKDCNLESEYPSSNVEVKISELEKVKENWREVQLKNVAEGQKKGTKRSSSTPSSKLVSREQANKYPRTVATAPRRPQPLQLYSPMYLQARSSPSLIYPRQFDAMHNVGMLGHPSYPPNFPQWNPHPNFGRGFFPY